MEKWINASHGRKISSNTIWLRRCAPEISSSCSSWGVKIFRVNHRKRRPLERPTSPWSSELSDVVEEMTSIIPMWT